MKAARNSKHRRSSRVASETGRRYTAFLKWAMRQSPWARAFGNR